VVRALCRTLAREKVWGAVTGDEWAALERARDRIAEERRRAAGGRARPPGGWLAEAPAAPPGAPPAPVDAAALQRVLESLGEMPEGCGEAAGTAQSMPSYNFRIVERMRESLPGVGRRLRGFGLKLLTSAVVFAAAGRSGRRRGPGAGGAGGRGRAGCGRGPGADADQAWQLSAAAAAFFNPVAGLVAATIAPISPRLFRAALYIGMTWNPAGR